MEEKLTNKKKRALKDKNIKLLAEAHNGLADYYNKRKRYRDALNEYQQLADLYEPQICNDSSLRVKWAECQRMIGEMYLSMGKFDEALQYVQKHLTVAQEFNNILAEIKAHETFGRIYDLMGKYKCNEEEAKTSFLAAEKAFMESLKLTVSPGLGKTATDKLMKDRALILVNISDVQHNLGNFDAAIQNIKKAKKICICKGYDVVLHGCYITEATMHCNKGNFDEALDSVGRALDLAGKLRNKVTKTCETLAHIAYVMCKMSNYEDAKKLLKQAWEMNTPVKEDNEKIVFRLKVVTAMCRTKDLLESTSLADYETRKKLYEKLGDGACRLRNYEGATEFYRKMLDNAQLAGDSGKTIATIYASLCITYRDMGRYKDALFYCQMEYELIKDMPREAFVALYYMSELQYLAKLYTLVETTCYRAWAAAKVTNVKNFEIMALKMLLKVLKRLEETDKIENIKNELRRLGFEDFDNPEITEEELSAIAGCDADSTHVGDDVDLEELRDELVTDEQLVVEKSIKTKMQKNSKGETSLHRACIRGNKLRVESLLAGGHPVNETDNCNWSPLHEACWRGYQDIVDILINANANVDAIGGDDREVTPLYVAAVKGHLQVVTLLLDRGANPSLKTKETLKALQQWRSQFIDKLDKNKETDYIRVCDRLKRSIQSTQAANCSSSKSTPHERTERDAAHTLPSTSKINSPLTYESLPSTSKVNSPIRDKRLPSTPKEKSPIRNESLPSELTISGQVRHESAPTSTAKICDSIRDVELPSNSEISNIFRDSKPQQNYAITYQDDSDDDVIIIEDPLPVPSDGRLNTNIAKYRDALLDSIGFVKIETFDDDDFDTTKKRTKKRKRNDGSTDVAANTSSENVAQPLGESNKDGKQKKTRKRKSTDGLNVNENSSCKSDEKVSPGRIGEDSIANTSTLVNNTSHENTVITKTAYKESIENLSKQIYYSFHEKNDGIDSSKMKPDSKMKKAKKSRPATALINGSSEELISEDSLDSDEFPAVDVKYTKPSSEMADDSDVNKQNNNKNRKDGEPSRNAAVKPSLLVSRSSTENQSEITEQIGECSKTPTQIESQNDEDMSGTRIVSHYFENDESMYVTAVESQAGLSDDDIDKNDNEGDSPNPDSEFNEVQGSNNMQPVDEIQPSNKATLIVHFEDKSLNIMLKEDTIRKATISWLIENLKSRLNGACPMFSLMTVDGVALSEDDPLSLVLSSPELKACVTNALLSQEPKLRSCEALELHNSITGVTPPHDEPSSPLPACDITRRRESSPPCLHEEETLLLPLPDPIETPSTPRFDRDETANREQVETRAHQDETLTPPHFDQDESAHCNPDETACFDQDETTCPNQDGILTSTRYKTPTISPHLENQGTTIDQDETLLSPPLKRNPVSQCDWPQPISVKKYKFDVWTPSASTHFVQDETPVTSNLEQDESPTFTMKYDGCSQSTTLHPKRDDAIQEESPSMDLLIPMEKSQKYHASSRSKHESSRAKHDKSSRPMNDSLSSKQDKSSHPRHDKSSHSRHDKSQPRHDESHPRNKNSSRSCHGKSSHHRHDKTSDSRRESSLNSTSSQGLTRDEARKHYSLARTEENQSGELPQLSTHIPNNDNPAQTTLSENKPSELSSSRKQDKPSRYRHDSSRNSTSQSSILKESEQTLPNDLGNESRQPSAHCRNPNKSAQTTLVSKDRSANLSSTRKLDKSPRDHNKPSRSRHDSSRKSTSSQSSISEESAQTLLNQHRDESPQPSKHRRNHNELAQTTLVSKDRSANLSSTRKLDKSRSSHDKTPHSRHDKSRRSTESRDQNGDRLSQPSSRHPKNRESLQNTASSQGCIFDESAQTTANHPTDESQQIRTHRRNSDELAQTTLISQDERSKLSPPGDHNKPSRSRHDSLRKSTSPQSSLLEESAQTLPNQHRDESPQPSKHRRNHNELTQTVLVSKDESVNLSSTHKHGKSRSSHDKTPHSRQDKLRRSTESRDQNGDRLSQPSSRHHKNKESLQNTTSSQGGIFDESAQTTLANHPTDESQQIRTHPRNSDELAQTTLVSQDKRSKLSPPRGHNKPSRSRHDSSRSTSSQSSLFKESAQTTSFLSSTHLLNESPQLSPHHHNDESSQNNAKPGPMHDESHQNISQHKQNKPKSSLSIILKRQDNMSWQTVAVTPPRPKAFMRPKDKSKHSRSKHDKSPQLISSRSKHNKVHKLSPLQRLKHKKLQRLKHYATRQPSSPQLGHKSSPRQLEDTESLPSSPLEHDLGDSQSQTLQLEDCGSPSSSHIENNASNTSPLHEDRVSPTQPYPEDGSPTGLNLEGGSSPPQSHVEDHVLPTAASLEDHVSPASPHPRYCESTQSFWVNPQPSQPEPHSNELPHHAFLAFPTSSDHSYPAPGVICGPSLPAEPQTPTNTAASIKMEYHPDEPKLDDDILELLGDIPNESPLGPPIHSRVAIKWHKILSSGLKQEDKDKIMNEYLVPYNCQLLEAPTLNPEVKAVVRETLVGLDSKIMNQQKRLGTAISALGMAVKSIISNENSKKNVLKSIFDACDLLCDMHREETETRRDYIMTAISSDLKESLVNTVRGKQLFGDNVRSIKSEPRFDFNLLNLIDEPSTSTATGNANLKQEIEDNNE